MNSVKAIAQFLETELAATAPSGDTLHQRIAMDRMPDSFENDTTAILIVKQSGAPAMSQAKPIRNQIAIHCYGGTAEYDECETVAARVWDVLHNQSGTASEGGIMFAQLATDSRYFEPDTGWPVVLAIYEVTTISTT